VSGVLSRYTGSHGTNGFYLKFESSGIGTDSSGNGNNFTPSGFTTSGTGTDVMSDTPTTNWATLNPHGQQALAFCRIGLSMQLVQVRQLRTTRLCLHPTHGLQGTEHQRT
jgi:hypothetical protein